MSSLFCVGREYKIDANNSPAVPSVRSTLRSDRTDSGDAFAFALPLAAMLATWPPVTASPSAISGRLSALIEMSTGRELDAAFYRRRLTVGAAPGRSFAATSRR